MNSQHKANILDYYNSCEWQYRMMWHLTDDMSISIGYWDKNVSNFRKARFYQNKAFAEWVNIQPTDKVLDAGCGVGGSSVWIAKNIGCQVEAITLVPRQKELADKNIEKNGVKDKVNVTVMDYHNLNFPDESFDVVWALESFCYADPKSRFVQEAFRVLKKGGRLIIIDLYQGKENLTPAENELLYTKTMNPMAVASMETMEQIKGHALKAGFEKCTVKDISPNVLPALRIIYWISLLAFPFAKLGYWLKRFTKREHESMILGVYAKKAYKQGLTIYGSVIAWK